MLSLCFYQGLEKIIYKSHRPIYINCNENLKCNQYCYIYDVWILCVNDLYPWKCFKISLRLIHPFTFLFSRVDVNNISDVQPFIEYIPQSKVILRMFLRRAIALKWHSIDVFQSMLLLVHADKLYSSLWERNQYTVIRKNNFRKLIICCWWWW